MSDRSGTSQKLSESKLPYPDAWGYGWKTKKQATAANKVAAHHAKIRRERRSYTPPHVDRMWEVCGLEDHAHPDELLRCTFCHNTKDEGHVYARGHRDDGFWDVERCWAEARYEEELVAQLSIEKASYADAAASPSFAQEIHFLYRPSLWRRVWRRITHRSGCR